MNKINPNTFEIPNVFTLVYVGASWCGPCKALKPKLTELLAKYPEFPFYEVDADEIDKSKEGPFSKVTSVPRIFAFQHGIELLNKVGFSLASIEEMINTNSIGEANYWEEFIKKHLELKPTHFHVNKKPSGNELIEFVILDFPKEEFIYSFIQTGDIGHNLEIAERAKGAFIYCELGQFYQKESYFLNVTTKQIHSETDLPFKLKAYGTETEI